MKEVLPIRVESDTRLELEAADGRKLELIAVSELMQQE